MTSPVNKAGKTPPKTPQKVKLQVQGLQTPRERIWAALLACTERAESLAVTVQFTAEDAQDMCSPMVHFEAVQKYLRDLVAAGYVAKTGGEPLPGRGARRSKPLYELVKRQADAPRLRDGKPHTRGMGQLAMWRCMKVLSTFTHRELASMASQHGLVVTPSAAQNYVRLLAKAGYLDVIQQGGPRLAATYKLSLYTGPHAPSLVTTRGLLDRNTHQVWPLQYPQEVCDAQAE